MRADRSGWPGPARVMASTIEAALDAARSADRAAFDEALASLTRVEREPLAALLGTAVVDGLHQQHPGGLDAESAEVLLDTVVRAARPWYPEVDDGLLLRALAGALDLGELPGDPPGGADGVLVHGLLLLAGLLRAGGARAAVDAAMAELIREQTVEMP